MYCTKLSNPHTTLTYADDESTLADTSFVEEEFVGDDVPFEYSEEGRDAAATHAAEEALYGPYCQACGDYHRDPLCNARLDEETFVDVYLSYEEAKAAEDHPHGPFPLGLVTAGDIETLHGAIERLAIHFPGTEGINVVDDDSWYYLKELECTAAFVEDAKAVLDALDRVIHRDAQ